VDTCSTLWFDISSGETAACAGGPNIICVWINDISLIRRQQGDFNNLYQEMRGDENMFMRVCAKTIQKTIPLQKYQQTSGRMVVLANPEVAILATTSVHI